MVGQKNFSRPLMVLFLFPGSGMDKKQDPGSRENTEQYNSLSLVDVQAFGMEIFIDYLQTQLSSS